MKQMMKSHEQEGSIRLKRMKWMNEWNLRQSEPHSKSEPRCFFILVFKPLLLFSFMHEAHRVRCCVFIYWMKLCQSHMQFSSTSHFTFAVQKKPIKIKRGKSNRGWMMQLFHNCLYLGWSLLYGFLFYLRVTQQRPSAFSLLGEKCLAQVQIKNIRWGTNQPRTNLVFRGLWPYRHFCLYCRTFHLPLPLSDEGKCQETVEDSPLLWTFSTWRAFWYDRETLHHSSYFCGDLKIFS